MPASFKLRNCLLINENRIKIVSSCLFIFCPSYKSNLKQKNNQLKIYNNVCEVGISRNDEIYCDCAEHDKIEKLRLAGYNVTEADKDVKLGIDYVKQQEIFTCHENVSLNKEREEYVYKKRKDGIEMEEPCPVIKGLVEKPEDWKYSSARFYL